MDLILAPLLNFGIGGCMAAAVLWFTYTLVQRTIPDIMRQQREDLAQAREDFRETLIHQQRGFQDSLVRLEERQQKTTDAIVAKLEDVDRHTKANQENTIQLQNYVLKYLTRDMVNPSDTNKGT